MSVQTINRWCRAGKLPATPQQFGQRQTYLISRATVDAVQNGAMTPQRTGPAPKEVLEHRSIVPRWLRAMQKGIITGKPFSPLTIEDYQRSIEGFLTRHPKLDFQAAQLEMMRCPTEQYGKRFKMHKAFVCFAKYLEAQGMASEALINDLKRLRPKRHLPPKRHAINDAELAKLLDVCKDLQDRLILVLLATTGLRVSEACNLKLCEIDPIQGFLVVNLGKGNKTRRLGVGDTLMGLIQDYVSTHPHDKAKGYLLINQDGKPQTRHGLRQTLKRLGNKAGVKVTPHSLRRYFATSNLLKGRPLPLVQRAMGHADIATTRAYCQDTEQQLIDAMRGWE